MNSKRLFLVLVSSTVLLAVASLAGVYQGKHILKQESNVLVDLKRDSAVLDLQKIELLQAKRDIKQFEELETITKSIVPREKDQANTITEIANLAQQSGLRLGSIDFPQSQLGAITKKGSNKKKNDVSADSKTTQLTELPDLKGVYVMEIKINTHRDFPAPYDNIIDFLERLERNRRTAQVTNLSIIPNKDSRNRFNLSITLNTYIRPE